MIRAGLLLLILPSTLFASGSLPPPSLLEDLNYSRRVWQSRDGLPEDPVQALAQTPDGYLWIGSSGGLIRFDGVHFTSFSPVNEPAFLDDSVYSLLVTRDGSLWIGTEGGGLVHYAGGKFRHYGFNDGLTNAYVRVIFQDRAGALWIGTDKGFFRKEQERFVRVDARDGIPPLTLNAICEDSKGRLLAGGTGLLVIEKGRMRFSPLRKDRADDFIRLLHEDREGTLWFGTVSTLRRIERGLAGDPFAVEPALDVSARAFYESPQGVFIATQGSGLLRWADGRWARLAAPRGLPHDNVLGLTEDREGNIWVGSQGGLTRISPSAARTLHVRQGDVESINTVYADPAGPMLVVSQGGKLYEVRGSQLVPHPLPKQIAAVPWRNAFRSHDGSLWLGTIGRGIYRVAASGAVSHLSVADGLINDFTRVFCESRDGTLWVGTNGGVSHLTGGKIENYNVDNGLAYNSVREIVEDRQGVIWTATDAGITRLSKGQFVPDGKLEALRGQKIWALFEDAGGGMWIGTHGTGLYLFRNGRLTRFPGKAGLPDKIHFITEDRRGTLWLTSSSGIFSVSRANLEAFVNGGPPVLAARLYNTSDGLETNQMNGGMQEAGAISRQGELWAPSTAGVVVLSGATSRPSLVPPLLLEQVIAGEESIRVPAPSAADGAIVVEPGTGKLELHYTAIRLRSPERLRFRYWMEGAEPDWNQVGDRRVAYFTNLSPGKYFFHVAAWDADDPARIVERVFPVVLLPTFYQTWWFLLLLGLLAISIAWGAYLLHVRNVRRQFVAVIEERTRVAREMHDTVIQGCVGVSALLEAASSTGESAPDVSRVMIERARDEIRVTVEDARSAVWNLRHSEEGNSIREAVNKLVRRVRTESGIDVDLETSGHFTALDSEAERGVVLSAREALSNAVRHSGATRIVVKMRCGDQWLSIDVLDNGSGFQWSGRAAGESRHYGLIGMKERMEKLGGSFDLDSAPGQGTRVRLRVPLPQST